jgi:FkbH-like protein
MANLKYSEILKINREFENSVKSDSYNISIIANIIVHQSKEIIEYFLRKEGINANIKLGSYDNIVQDSQEQQNVSAVIIFWELANLFDGLEFKIEMLNDNEIDKIENKLKSEINFTLKNLKDCPLILFNKFSSLIFSSPTPNNNKLDTLADRLNNFLDKTKQPNLKLINLDKIIANIGVDNSLDSRYYYSSKAPYTIKFFQCYSQFILPYFISANGMAKKAIIFDCDNTLWGGIIGEDGIKGINLSTSSNIGKVFQEIQTIALSLAHQGVIIGICSKNNPKEVDQVLNSHPDMILKEQHIAIKAVNWSNKVTNLKKISKELNIGLDSLVFVDDSDFEVSLIKSQLPEVTVIKVPEKIYEYPKKIRDSLGLFYSLTSSLEDKRKTEIYRANKLRNIAKAEFLTIDDYLRSLKLKITIFKNDESLISRLSQMTQKTNQFNLTTKRYTENEIESMVLSDKTNIYAFSLKDSYGDSGITGLCIIINEGSIAMIDTLLMSCRVIGRNIEYVFMDYIVESLSKSNIKNIQSRFIKTMKNKQVNEFFESCSFKLMNEEGPVKNYNLRVSKYKKSVLDYIELERNGE